MGKPGAMALFLFVLPLSMAAQKKPSANPSGDRLDGIPAGRTRVVDLSYPIHENFPAWPGDMHAFEAQTNASVEKDGYFTRKFSMLEHFGTHLDAPVHFPPGQATVDQISPEKLFGPAVVIDVRAEGEKDPDYQLPPEKLEQWEKRNGRIPAGAIVLLRTGWSARVGNAALYRHQDEKGVMHFPGFSAEAAKLLIRREVSGLGADTMSVEYGASQDFAVHKISLGAGLYHLENLADLGALPEAGAFLIVAPIKLEGGSGGPVRVFAVLPDRGR